MTSLRCTGCGSADVVVVDPGHEAVIDVVTDIMLRRGRPMSGRCLACWKPLSGQQQELFKDAAPMDEGDEAVRQAITYNPADGSFCWKRRASAILSGAPAGEGVRQRGKRFYRTIQINRHIYYAHRLAWFLMTGRWPPHLVDHINGDGTDNRWANLRLANPGENSRNAGLRSDNQSGFRGVHQHSETRRWVSQIRAGLIRLNLGTFDTPEQAHEAYRRAAIDLHGEFARPGGLKVAATPPLRDAAPAAVEDGEQGGLFDPITGR